jgi:hypothetical protein
VRIVSLLLTVVAVSYGPILSTSVAQSLLSDAAPFTNDAPGAFASTLAPTPATEPVAPLTSAADAANIDGCQMIAKIDGQVVLACEVLWNINKRIEDVQKKLVAAGQPPIPPEELQKARLDLMKVEVASLLDRKLLYGEFRRTIPAERIPDVEETLREHFEGKELPLLMKQFGISGPVEMELELARLGSSMADVRRAFNEKAIAADWIRSKVTVKEDVSPDEMLAFYQAHLSNYEQPARARWEELTVHKSKFGSPAEAYAALANMGNEVWKLAETRGYPPGPAFADVARAKSHGYTAKDGGVRDWTDKGAFRIKTIDDALFTLQVGEMSDILETEDAFYIVRVLERVEAGRKPFTEVQAKIREDLKEERFKTAVDVYLAKLRKDARIWTVFTGDISAEALIETARRPNGATPR